MGGKIFKKSARSAKKDAAKQVVAEPKLLSGGNPQIPKADGVLAGNAHLMRIHRS